MVRGGPCIAREHRQQDAPVAGNQVVKFFEKTLEKRCRCRLEASQLRKEVIDVYELQVQDGSSPHHWN
jgi:hypothetical protein